MSDTLLDRLEASLLEARRYNEVAEVAPVAVLWPDQREEFKAAVQQLRSRMPILTLGEFKPDASQGPAYWIRCALAGTVELELPEGTPVVYMPSVAREELRAIEECPRELAPIAELQYRGQWFSHPNGKDWTIRGFLMNEDRGPGLGVAQDQATQEALADALEELLVQPMKRLRNQYIDAEFLHLLLNPDPEAQLLAWMDEPDEFRARHDEAQWKAFVGLCKSRFDFDPTAEGEVIAGKHLGLREGNWDRAWRRFAEEPARYSGVEARLRQGRPMKLFVEQEDSWPQVNEDAEEELRTSLNALANAAPAEARQTIQELWEKHRPRRNWVWAKLDQAQLAFAVEHLQRLAELTKRDPTGEVDELVQEYAETGWEADHALLSALTAANTRADREAVAAAATALYRPWIDAHAKALQGAIGPNAKAGAYSAGGVASTEKGTVTIFVDGLRLDLGHRLVDKLGGLEIEVETALAALPTVTQTAKPALTPLPQDSISSGSGLAPARASSGAMVNSTMLKGLMAERGLQILEGAETGDPAGCAWTEAANIDRRGHDFGLAFIDEIDRELDDIGKRVKLLLDAGWEQVHVVTDHGWILLPGGMEKIELPAATAEVKKGRCARLKPGADVSVPTVPWHWDPDVRIAVAPGTGCFVANQEYEHGGVSLQECVVPRLKVQAGVVKPTTGGAAITKVKWLGLMCRVEFENVAPGATVDIRALPADTSTSVVHNVKETGGAGKQSLHVPDEELENEKAYVVVLGRDGSILAQREVIIGVNR